MRLHEHRFPFPEYEPIRNYKTMKVLKKEMQEMNYYDKEERQSITMFDQTCVRRLKNVIGLLLCDF